MKDRERKRETESLLGQLPDERFAQLVNLGKKLTDWSNEQVALSSLDDRADDDEMDDGVPVTIGDGDEEEEEEGDYREIDDIEEDDEEQEEEVGEEAAHSVIKGKVIKLKCLFVCFFLVKEIYGLC